jgi:hypothetical protein
MRHSSGRHHAGAEVKTFQRGDWRVIRDLLPYLWEYKFRVGFDEVETHRMSGGIVALHIGIKY